MPDCANHTDNLALNLLITPDKQDTLSLLIAAMNTRHCYEVIMYLTIVFN